METANAKTDAGLVQEVLNGNREAFGMLVERHYRSLRAVALAYSHAPADADDLVQETCIKAYQALNKLRNPDRFLSWSIKTLIRIAHDHKRKTVRRAKLAAVTAMKDAVETPVPQRDEMRAIVRRELEALDEHDRAVLMLKYYAGETVRDIAKALGISPSAVAKRLQRAREALGERLVEYIEEPERESDHKWIAGVVAAVLAVEPLWSTASAGTVASLVAQVGASRIAAGFVAAIAIGVAGTVYWTSSGDEAASSDDVAVLEDVPQLSPGDVEERPAVRAPTEPISDALAETVNTSNDSVTASVYGRVFIEGSNRPIANAELRLYAEVEGGNLRFYSLESETDDLGHYRLDNLEPGIYTFLTYSLNGLVGGSIQKKVEVHAGDEVVFDIRLERGIVIAGTVVDEVGKPLSGVYLQGLSNQKNVLRQAESDNEGTFEMVGFETTGRGFRIEARKAGYAMQPLDGIVVPEGGLTGLRLTMVPESTASGRVVDVNGRAVSDVQIVVRDIAGSTYALLPKARSADDGSFNIEGLFEGEFRLILSDPGGNYYYPANGASQINVGAGEHIRNLVFVSRMGSGSPVAGQVVDSAGRPCDGARVQLRGPMEVAGSTDQQGRYRFNDLPEGVYSVIVSEGYRFAAVDNVHAGSENVNVVLPAYAVVSGNVVDAVTGEPIPDFEIAYATGQLDATDGLLLWGLREHYDETGGFNLKQVVPGNATILVRAGGYAPNARFLENVEDSDRIDDVQIALERGAIIEGVVRNIEKQPLSGARIYFGPLPEQQYQTHAAIAETTAAGAFAVQVAPADKIMLTALHTGYAPASIVVHGARQNRSGAEIVLSDGGAVHAQVTLNGQPLSGASVMIMVDGTRLDSGMSDADGGVRVEHVPPGLVELVASLPRGTASRGWPTFARAAIVEEGAETQVDLAATTADTLLEGSIINNGQSVTAGWLIFEVPTELGSSRHTVSPDSLGRFAVEGLPAGVGTVEWLLVPGEAAAATWPIELVDGQLVQYNLTVDSAQ